MPRGPEGQKRPADVVGNAIRGIQLAVGEAEEEFDDDGKYSAAKALGAKGGCTRAKKLTPKQRSETVQKAAAKRWGNS